MSRDEEGSAASNWLTWFLGIGNFVLVTLLGAYFSYKTQELETRISTIQTAGQFIAIVSDDSAPGYAKGLALNAIFNERLLSRDLIMETAYRIEDEILERTVVGPLLYQIAGSEDFLHMPFGYVDYVEAHNAPDGSVELSLGGWALDDEGWSSDRTVDGKPGLPFLLVLLGSEVHCKFPSQETPDCRAEIKPRGDIPKKFPRYPDAGLSGFAAKFTIAAELDLPVLMTVRLIDRGGRTRVVYSRCIDFGQPIREGRVTESPYQADGCVGS